RWADDAPSDPRPLLWRTQVDRRIGAGRPVIIGHFQEALRRDPACDEARLGLADLFYVDGRDAESAELYVAHVARNPDDAAGYVGVAINARTQGEVDQAAAALDRALALAPDDTLALKERAAIDVARRRPGDALVRLDRAITLDPFDPEQRYQRSLVLAALGRRDEAVAEARRSQQLRRQHEEMAAISAQLTHQPTD